MSEAKPYCKCWPKLQQFFTQIHIECSCGEEDNIIEWKWVNSSESSDVILSDSGKVATFNPRITNGMVYVVGDTPMKLNYHYYWEVKILTHPGYGMVKTLVGLGTDKFDEGRYSRHSHTPPLGLDTESYGLTHMGTTIHDSQYSPRDYNHLGFVMGSIIGIRLDMWQGTLEFFINRKPQGISFCNLRRHTILYPIVCSSSIQCSIKLIYAASWKASLTVDALRILSVSPRVKEERLPPGLKHMLKTRFWLTAFREERRLTRSRTKRIKTTQ